MRTRLSLLIIVLRTVVKGVLCGQSTSLKTKIESILVKNKVLLSLVFEIILGISTQNHAMDSRVYALNQFLGLIFFSSDKQE